MLVNLCENRVNLFRTKMSRDPYRNPLTNERPAANMNEYRYMNEM